MSAYVEYLDSYVYPTTKWLLGNRQISSCILNVSTYPNSWSILPGLDLYNSDGSHPYSWFGTTALPSGGGVICPSGSSAWSFLRTTYQEYVNKGGAYGIGWTYASSNSATNLSGWLGYYTSTMP
jgi:hypothetical protein